MADQPGQPNQQPTQPAPTGDAPAQPGPSVETQLAEIKAAREEIAAQRKELEAQTAQTTAMQGTLSNLINDIRQPAPVPEPEPEPVNPADFADDPVAGAQAMSQQAIEDYHKRMSPYLESFGSTLHELQYQQVRSSDTKNFDRLKKHVDQYFQTYPQEKMRSGAVLEVFERLKGKFHSQLVEADAQDRAKEPSIAPNPPTGPAKRSKDTQEYDELNEEEMHVARGLGVDPKIYFQNRYGREMRVPEDKSNAS